jgi:hypothetical protein
MEKPTPSGRAASVQGRRWKLFIVVVAIVLAAAWVLAWNWVFDQGWF